MLIPRKKATTYLALGLMFCTSLTPSVLADGIIRVPKGTKAGVYDIRIIVGADGEVTATKIPYSFDVVITDLSRPEGPKGPKGPVDPVDPVDPGNDIEPFNKTSTNTHNFVANKIHKLTTSDKYLISKQFGVLYTTNRNNIDFGAGFDVQKFVNAQKMANNIILSNLTGKNRIEFEGLLKDLAIHQTTLRTNGRLVNGNDFEKVWAEIEAGFFYKPANSVVLSEEELNLPQILQLIMQILQLLRDLRDLGILKGVA